MYVLARDGSDCDPRAVGAILPLKVSGEQLMAVTVREARSDAGRADLRTARALVVSAVAGGMLWTLALLLAIR